MFVTSSGKVYDSFEAYIHTLRHGTKLCAWRRKFMRHEGEWRYYKVSKSWKDQSKRKHQYR